jgi:hypothetical protein
MKDEIIKLNNLLISSDVERLNAELNEFNPFEVLGVSSYEIRHSNTLGWLFDPKSQHNLGDVILKKFILKTLQSNDKNISNVINLEDDEKGPFDLVRVQLMDLSDVIIEREKNDIDVLVVSPSNKLVIAIENKIKAKESAHQLQKYKNDIIANYPEYTKLLIFLTLHGEEAENDDEFMSVSHNVIVDIVKLALELYGDRMNSKVSDFIEFYIKTLEKQIRMDSDIRDLALKVYNENKEAIDLINSVLKSEVYNMTEAGNAFKKSLGDDIKEWKKSNASYWFAPKKLINDKVSEELKLHWPSDFPIALFFYRQESRGLRLYIEVGPIEDQKLRERLMIFLEELKDGDNNPLFKISANAKAHGAKYSKIYSEYKDVSSWKKEDVVGVMKGMYKKALEKVDILSDELKSFDWHLED